ncbi:MAG: hypothetical protein ACXWV6_11275 [Chitinophagaceae bacterium]
MSEIPITAGITESDEGRYKVDVVVIKIIKDMPHRSLSFGEGEGG